MSKDETTATSTKIKTDTAKTNETKKAYSLIKIKGYDKGDKQLRKIRDQMSSEEMKLPTEASMNSFL